jgi:hypothetical protein
MRRSISVLAALTALALLVTASTASVAAKAPARGVMDLQFNLAWPGPQADIPDWVGTITFDGDEYGMAFFALGTGKPFDADPSTSVHFFEETYVIYESLDYAFDTDGNLTLFDPGPVVMAGPDTGLTNMINSRYHMTGRVAEASGPFAALEGRPVFMSGLIEWYPFGAPRFAPGELRVL